MELRDLVHILRRRWWIPFALAGFVGLLSAIQLRPWQSYPIHYLSSLRMLITIEPATNADTSTYDPRYFAALVSEYLVDDFTEVVRSELFARNISERLADLDIAIPGGLIQGQATTGKQHRIITLSFHWPDRDQAHEIANAAVAELEEDATLYFQQLATSGAVITLLDGPTVHAIGPTLRTRLEFPLRLILGLIAGVFLVFFLDYWDTSVRGPRELEELDIKILGAIPRY
ncbi:hypothetical protein KFU94_45370 [Chloroflexi bacterium TSY]|nr:hypothetical protein [Chloroflexi bacterium TSY]